MKLLTAVVVVRQILRFMLHNNNITAVRTFLFRGDILLYSLKD